MKPLKYYIGIDVSKLTMDFAVYHNNEVIAKAKIDNNESSIKTFLTKLKTEYRCNNKNSVFCAENMGIYNANLCRVALKRKLLLALESPLHIKKSLGLHRGKNDSIDAVRIARYSSKNYNELRFWKPPRPVIQRLKALAKIRARIIKVQTILKNSKKDEKHFLSEKISADLKNHLIHSITALAADIKRVEAEIKRIIDNDEQLTNLMKIVTSIPFIGTVIGVEMIISTNEFEKDWTAKKFACYCGIAPFEYKSGESLKGRGRVSHFANKNIKRLLHLASISMVSAKKSQLQTYYKRKVAEGKNK